MEAAGGKKQGEWAVHRDSAHTAHTCDANTKNSSATQNLL